MRVAWWRSLLSRRTGRRTSGAIQLSRSASRSSSGVTGTLVVHDLDAAHDLGVANADSLLDPATAARYRDALVALLGPRLALHARRRPSRRSPGARLTSCPIGRACGSRSRSAAVRPGHVGIHAYVFPYDPIHQTFINIYEDSALKLQAILDASHQDASYYSGSTQGRWAVVKTFVLSGIEHILIGPDHILFLIGLLLLGGTLSRLALIVTVVHDRPQHHALARGARHRVAAGAIHRTADRADHRRRWRGQPARACEREGTRASVAPGPASDIRAWLAVAFGLIHGFGFAYVLKEFGLPQAALGWSLFAFNLGVEIGQLLIVGVVAGSVADGQAKRSPRWRASVCCSSDRSR